MNIAPIEDKTSYQNLADKYGSIFNSLHWQKIFGDSIKLYGIYDNGNHLIGGFHLCFFKKYGFSCIINPPFIPNIGLFYINQTSNRSSNTSYNKEVIHVLTVFLTQQKYSLLDISLPKSIIDTQPLQWNGFSVSPKYTYIIDLKEETETIWDNFSSQRRKSIRKAISDNLEVKLVHDYKETSSLIEKTFSRQEKNIDLQLIDAIFEKFANATNSFAFIVYANSQPIAVTFCLYDKDTAYYLLGGYDEKIKHHGPGALAMWESIQQAKKLGLENFDFEGSMIPSIEEYFREFGGRLVPFYKINKSAWPLRLFKS